MADFWVSVSNSAGTVRYCELHSVPSWTSTNMLDKAGTFAFQIPAADPNSAQLAKKRVVTCYTTVNGLQTEVGSGIIDRITLSLDAESNPTGMLNVTGSSRLRELVYRHVGPLLIDNGAGVATLTGPQLIIALAPSGWTLDVVDGANVTTKAVYHQFQDESVLTAFVKLAEITGEHFRAGVGKSLVWLNFDLWDAANASGVRAFYNADPMSIEDNDLGVVITRISKTSDSYDYFIGRAYAFGVGDGVSRVTLNGSVNPGSWSADWVQGSDSKGYYLQHTPTWNTYGIESVIQWKDEATAQTLLETTYEYMRRSQNPVEQYSIDLVGLKTTLEPGTTIRVIAHEYVDTYHSINIDADLVIMTVNNRVDSDGLRTVSLTCSTIDKYTATEFTVMADQLAQADNYYTHTQPSGSLPGLATSITPGKTLTLAATDNYTVTFPATGTAAIGAGINTVSSTNNTASASHTHAITSSSNPGAAASLLASDASGYLTLVRLGIGATPTYPIDVIDATAAFRIDSNRTNNTQKFGRWILTHYGTGNNPILLAQGVTNNTISTLNLGGGSASYNAVTDISFYTGATITTATGTVRAKIDSAGLFTLNYGLTVNESGDAAGDVRMESDTEVNMFLLDANGNTDGTIYLGGSTNGIQITKGGEITLIGTATRWNDLRVEPVVRNTGSKAPSFISWLSGLYLYDFDDVAAGSEKEIFFQVQMPHDWKEQSTIHPHVHWTNKTGSTAGQVVRWGLEYNVATIGGTFGTSTTIYGTTIVGGGDITVANEHILTELPDITMTNNLISTVLVCRLFRNSSDAADTYTGTAGLLYVDFHYEIDTIGGSKDEFTK